VVQTLHNFSLFSLARHGRVQCGIQEPVRLLKRGQVTQVATAWQAPESPRQVRFADAAHPSPVRLEQGKQTRRPVLLHLPPPLFLLRGAHRVMRLARDQPVAASRVRVELPAGLQGKIGRLLHRLDGNVPCRRDAPPPWRLTQAIRAGRSWSS
jgi:hypothetical protein